MPSNITISNSHSAKFDSTSLCFEWVNVEPPQCNAPDTNSATIEMTTLGDIQNKIAPAIEFEYESTESMGAYHWMVHNFGGNRGAYMFFEFHQAGHHDPTTQGTVVNLDAAGKIHYVKKNGEESGEKNVSNWGGTSPMVYTKNRNATWGATHAIFKDVGWGTTSAALADWDMEGSEMPLSFAMYVGSSALYKIFSILNYGDNIRSYIRGAFRPAQLSAASCPDATKKPGVVYQPCTANSAPDGVNTFVYGGPQFTPSPSFPAPANTWSTSAHNTYQVRIPYTFRCDLKAIDPDPTEPNVSPKVQWSKNFDESEGIDGAATMDFPGEAGRLVILEPTTTTETQKVHFAFRNTGLGSLRIVASNFEGKISDEALDETTRYADVSGSTIDSATVRGLWPLQTEVAANSSLYIYQPTNYTDSSYLHLDELNFTRVVNDDIMTKWVIVKFDLAVYKKVKKNDAGGTTNVARIANVLDIAVAYQCTTTNAGAVNYREVVS